MLMSVQESVKSQFSESAMKYDRSFIIVNWSEPNENVWLQSLEKIIYSSVASIYNH